jgi:hypothetical protein
LALGALGRIAGGLELTLEGASHLILFLGSVSVRQDRCLNRGRLHDPQDLGGDRPIDPPTAKADAARLAFVEPGAVAGIARRIVSAASVVHGELRGAAATTQKTCEQGIAGTGRPVMAGGESRVAADHPLDALEALPVHVAFVGVRDQNQPAIAWLPSLGATGLAAHVVHRTLGLPVRVGTPVDRVRQQLVERCVGRALPVNLPARRGRGQLQTLLQEPQQRLAYRTDPLELIEHQANRLLDAAIRVLLEALIVALAVADRGHHDQFAALGLRAPRLERALAQQVELVLVEAPLEPEQQSVVAGARGVHGLLVDQHRVDDAADLDELLPLAAVARKARHLACGHRPDASEAHLGHHALEATARFDARCRAAEILINDLDLRKTQIAKARLHGVLQLAALAVVSDLEGRGLPHVQHRFARPVLRLDLLTHCPPRASRPTRRAE